MFKKYKNDIFVLCILFIISVIAFCIISISKKQGDNVVVSIDGEVYETYNLNDDITVKLDIGNTLVIDKGEAYVSESTCKDKICVNHGRISSIGENIVCLPHKLVIEVKGGVDSD